MEQIKKPYKIISCKAIIVIQLLSEGNFIIQVHVLNHIK